MKKEKSEKTTDLLKDNYKINDFIYCMFTDQFGYKREDFGIIVNCLNDGNEDRYLIRLLQGGTANVLLDSIRKAGRA